MLVQAAWSYWNPPRVGRALKRIQEDQLPEVVGHSLKTQHRPHRLYNRIGGRRKHQIAMVVCARELVDVVWAVTCELEEERRAQSAAA